MTMDLQKRIYDLLHVDMSEWRAEEISKITIDAIQYLQNKIGREIDLQRNLTEEEIKDLILTLESDPDYKSHFRGYKQKIRWGMQRLAYIWENEHRENDNLIGIVVGSDEKVMLGINRFRNHNYTQISDPSESGIKESILKVPITDLIRGERDEGHCKQNDAEVTSAKKTYSSENLSEGKTQIPENVDENDLDMKETANCDFQTFSRKVYDVLERYPDVGLIPEQILDLTGQEYYEVKTVIEILKSAKWCKERKKRFYFVPVEDYEEPEASPEIISVFESYATTMEIDETVKELMTDPTELLKYLQSKKK